jgi:pimeloyl-ACP methyl ester carboxylesterase
VLTERVESWRDAGGFEEVAGRQLYVQRRDGAGPLLLLLHGFPSSSYDWRELLALRPASAALAFDCLGFGLSDKPREHTYTLAWQADAAEELVRRQGNPPPVFVVAHDMGTSVATELMARDLRGELDMDLRGALLFNGSMLLHLSRPTPAQRLLRSRLGPLFSRLTTERGFRAQFSRVFSAEHPLSAAEAADQWSLIAHNGGQRIGHLLVNYMAERERFTERWHGAFRDWPGPLSLTWGLKDPVARVEVLDGLRELRPGVEVLELPELAHYPQIEAPRRVAAALDRALATAGFPAS